MSPACLQCVSSEHVSEATCLLQDVSNEHVSCPTYMYDSDVYSLSLYVHLTVAVSELSFHHYFGRHHHIISCVSVVCFDSCVSVVCTQQAMECRYTASVVYQMCVGSNCQIRY
jgi:hypothetical protein